MLSSEEIEHALRETLAHLFDPGFEPWPGLCPLIGCRSDQGAAGVQAAILRLIQDQRPDENSEEYPFHSSSPMKVYHTFKGTRWCFLTGSIVGTGPPGPLRLL